MAASAVLLGATLAPLPAQRARPPPLPARPTSIAQTARAVLAPGAFSIEQILSYPYVEDMVASPTQPKFAWVVVRAGVRNVWEPPVRISPHRLTDYRADDGQELTNLSISADGKVVVFVRGGDHDANWDAEGGLQPDPSHSPIQPKVQIWAVAIGNGSSRTAPKLLADGDLPVLSPRGDRIVFVKDNQLSVVPIDGSSPAKSLFFSRGTVESPVWSPSGDRLAFVTRRGDHSFIGVFSSDSAPILYLAPDHVATTWRRPGRPMANASRSSAGPGAAVRQRRCSICIPIPGQIWTADATTGAGHARVAEPDDAPRLLSRPTTHLAFAAGDRLMFLSDIDGWPHLYSVPQSGGAPLLLTPGAFMAEYVSETPDRVRDRVQREHGDDGRRLRSPASLPRSRRSRRAGRAHIRRGARVESRDLG